jgi:hypothetical protein
MNLFDLDSDVQQTAQRVADLSQQVAIDLQLKTRLREELLRRHQELTAEQTQRAAARLRPRFQWPRRLTLVAPPILALLVALAVFVVSPQLSGHQSPQAAEAARIASAAVRTVPTVTGWQVTVRQVRKDTETPYSCLVPLHSGERLFIRDGRVYVYAKGQWYVPTDTHSACPFEWQWAFAVLPGRLQHHQFTILPDERIDGRTVETIRYTLPASRGRSIVATAWFDRQTGLVMRLEHLVMRGHTVIERDVADYRYMRSP